MKVFRPAHSISDTILLQGNITCVPVLNDHNQYLLCLGELCKTESFLCCLRFVMQATRNHPTCLHALVLEKAL
ncbi:UNVERIFIED_CONTAM: hypothetical protein K2H54_040377 [Gekko kuhli]